MGGIFAGTIGWVSRLPSESSGDREADRSLTVAIHLQDLLTRGGTFGRDCVVRFPPIKS